MPTSAALDQVGKKLGFTVYQVPTGWKFFGNLMDSGMLSICGEESFGTGSNHIREKDGIWAVLAWLNIIAGLNKDRSSDFISVKRILEDHWKVYGRNYFTRYDFEEVTTEAGSLLINNLRSLVESQSLLSTSLSGNGETYTVSSMVDFEYVDPVDKSVSSKQGIVITFTDGSRIVYRSSGTGSSGATIRIYVEKYSLKWEVEAKVALKGLVEIGLSLAKVEELTGRTEPTVIT